MADRRRRTTAVTVLVSALPLAFTVACRHEGPLGPPDSYLIYEPVAPGAAGAAATSAAAAPASPLLRAVPLDDARVVPVHRAALEGFVGEMLRTDYLAKALLRDGWQGRAFAPAARARAAEPTVLVLAGSRSVRTDEAKLGIGLAVPAFLGRRQEYPNAAWIQIGDDPASDPALVQTASGRIARLIAERLTGGAGAAAADTTTSAGASPAALVSGYAWAMEVIGREWRVGEGPRGTIPPDAGTATQRERFAAVRQNGAVMAPDDSQSLRPGAEMLTEPGVIASLIYRMAQSKTVGHRVAAAETYAPFVGQRVPAGVSPAAVLGPVRNFQAKLLVAWGRAILGGHPPRDLADSTAAYADTHPGERAEVYRLFVVTTFGATVKAGGVSPRAADAGAALAELTALAAEVAAGRRTLRQGL